ncbi:MAG: phosphate ABC transporter permease PstA [Mycobacteriales bacterium]
MTTTVPLGLTDTTARGGTTVHRPDAQPPAERRRSTSTLRLTDLYAAGGAAAASICLTALLYRSFAPFNGKLGAVVIAWLLFVTVYTLLVGFDEDSPAVRDKVAAVVVHSLAFVVLLALVFVVGFALVRGRSALLHSNFLSQDLSNTGPLDPLTSGGILHAVVGTLEQIGLALAFTVPLGLTCAVFLSEIPGRFARFVRTVSEAMTALPSIVAGLFIYAAFILVLGGQKSGIAAAFALSVMMLPIIIRAADVVLRLVPGSLKEASLALGSGQWRTVWHVTLPTARSGLATAVILGAARGIGETSPVLLTAGYTASLNANPLAGPQVSLPLAVFELVKSPQQAVIARGFGAAATLLTLVLLLFVLARVIGGRGPGEMTSRQRRRRTAASERDAQRFSALLSTPSTLSTTRES